VRILLAIPSLRCGGSERVMSILANHWAAAGHDVAVATFEPPERDFFALDPNVRRFVIGTTGGGGVDWMRANAVRLRELRSAISAWKADVVLSFLYTMNLLAIGAGRGLAPVVVAERTDPRFNPIERWQAALRRLLYPRAAAVVVQTEDVLEAWARVVARGAITRAIPNPALVPRPAAWPGDPVRGPVVAAAGRLEPGKGFDVLMAAFAQIAADHADWSLVILGEGAERAALTALAARAGISDRVFMPGTGDTAALFARAEVFASASRVEGFPNVLLEAMAAGLPVVCTDCRSGPREIIRAGADGYLVAVDDIAGFARALSRLMGDEELRRSCGGQAREVLERFALDRVAADWEGLFGEVQLPR
jgi:GalNAc-alpha-(1->4)-GalNAc-alpha-(1->3)-diNAcBac-PP-undecaprenol alpha-1,4-N-acetyl-D-galactosaminyltransferase